jgi:hypothetical protein
MDVAGIDHLLLLFALRIAIRDIGEHHYLGFLSAEGPLALLVNPGSFG